VEPEEDSNAAIKWLAGIAVVAVIAIGTVLLFRFGPWTTHKAPVLPSAPVPAADTLPGSGGDSTARAGGSAGLGPDRSLTTAPAAAAPETSRTPPPATTPSASVRAPVTTLSARAAVNPAAAAAPSAAPARPATTLEFSIAVGTYLDRSRAESEVARIGGEGSLPGRLVEVPREGVTMYAVIVGAFRDRGSAERKASDLVSRGIVDEARVLSRTVPSRP
jgi:cell division septation protein DedD